MTMRAIRTVMFTDLVGSTRLRTTTGDDAVDLRLDVHRSAVDAICAEHGGTVVKDTGDGCLVAFTSARSAIAAALALQAEPAGLGDCYEPDHDQEDDEPITCGTFRFLPGESEHD